MIFRSNLLARKPCPLCERGTLVPQFHTEELQYRGAPVHVRIEVGVCDRCEEETIDADQARRNDVAIRNAYKGASGLLSDSRVRTVRSFLGLTQREASELFGGGPNSFAKYETGRVAQSRAVDILLRLAAEDPQIVDRIQRLSDQVENVLLHTGEEAVVLSVSVRMKKHLTDTRSHNTGLVCKSVVGWHEKPVGAEQKVSMTINGGASVLLDVGRSRSDAETVQATPAVAYQTQ
jgi:HTH-type transcriptional regulator/antitoxin MqsA